MTTSSLNSNCWLGLLVWTLLWTIAPSFSKFLWPTPFRSLHIVKLVLKRHFCLAPWTQLFQWNLHIWVDFEIISICTSMNFFRASWQQIYIKIGYKFTLNDLKKRRQTNNFSPHMSFTRKKFPLQSRSAVTKMLPLLLLVTAGGTQNTNGPNGPCNRIASMHAGLRPIKHRAKPM